ncbi:MAG: peptidoglycan DD-metalloendopeptidase family protein, partial [Oscillospiraceae bacterium]|nr:peptidoglycan DD-metalloendopeptidase family protein [Oscillospiraceae bacterium]
CFCLTAFPAFAVSQAEIDALEEQRDALKENEANINEQLQSLENSKESALERKTALDEQSAILRQDILLLEEEIELYNGLVADKKAAADEAKEQEEDHYELYLSRVRDMEEYSPWNYVNYILKSDSISSLLSRLSDISDIMRFDEDLREEYIASREKAEQVLAEYISLQEALIEKQSELRERERELEEKIEASARILLDLEQDIENYKSYLEAVDAEMASVQKLIDEKAEELRKQQAAEEAAKNQWGWGGMPSSGYYSWPSYTSYITSPFGPRIHPIYGQLKPHTGVDIGASYGTAVTAAADGIVSVAVLDFGSTGYGTYVAIYHPNGTTTLYGHMSALAVSTGQQVSRGQVIGYVGSTGASNGPHIHFEIRVNGGCVDPMQYF